MYIYMVYAHTYIVSIFSVESWPQKQLVILAHTDPVYAGIYSLDSAASAASHHSSFVSYTCAHSGLPFVCARSYVRGIFLFSLHV